MLNKYFDKNNNIEDVDRDIMETFLDTMLDSKYDLFLELYKTYENFASSREMIAEKLAIKIKI